jgi:hypothetical protein
MFGRVVQQQQGRPVIVELTGMRDHDRSAGLVKKVLWLLSGVRTGRDDDGQS